MIIMIKFSLHFNMKTIKTIIILVAIIFVFSCSSNPCRNKWSVSSSVRVYLVHFPDTPKNAELYVYSRNNGFKKPRIRVENVNVHSVPLAAIGNIPHNEGEVIVLDFSHNFLRLLSNREYRVVVNDSIYFDISDLVFRQHVVYTRMSTFGFYPRSCATFEMKINGIPLNEDYLPAWAFNLPYSMRRIVEKK